MSGNRAYVISFAIFFAVLLAGLSFIEIKKYETRTFHEEEIAEIDANRVWLARQVITVAYAEGGSEDFDGWSLAVKKYCMLEGLKCGIWNQSVKIEGRMSWSEFPLQG